MNFIYEIKITYKDSVNDPEGLTITESSQRIGFKEITKIRSGKLFIINIEASNENEANIRIDEICDKLLHNLVEGIVSILLGSISIASFKALAKVLNDDSSI